TSLLPSVAWLVVAWLTWGGLLAAAEVWPGSRTPAARYLALCLLGCAGVSVLGARRPGVGAWNFVTLGLLAVLLLPVAEGWGHVTLSGPRLLFVAGTLAVGVLNYLPTRLWPAALLLGAACTGEVLRLAEGVADSGNGAGSLNDLGFALTP